MLPQDHYQALQSFRGLKVVPKAKTKPSRALEDLVFIFLASRPTLSPWRALEGLRQGFDYALRSPVGVRNGLKTLVG